MRRVLGLVYLVLFAAILFGAKTASLPFEHDDYASALRQAKQRNLPIFVEVSAPW